MRCQIDAMEHLITDVTFTLNLATAANLDSKPRSRDWLSLPTLLSLLSVVTAGIVLYVFLAIEPPTVQPF